MCAIGRHYYAHRTPANPDGCAYRIGGCRNDRESAIVLIGYIKVLAIRAQIHSGGGAAYSNGLSNLIGARVDDRYRSWSGPAIRYVCLAAVRGPGYSERPVETLYGRD